MWPSSRHQLKIFETSPLHLPLGIFISCTPEYGYEKMYEKSCQKKKEKQRCLKHEQANVNVPNIASTDPSQKRAETPQKINDYLGNLQIDETNINGAPEATFEQIPCIRKVNDIHPTFAKELGL